MKHLDHTKQGLAGHTENLHLFLENKVGREFDQNCVLKRSFQLQCENMNRASIGPIRIYDGG